MKPTTIDALEALLGYNFDENDTRYNILSKVERHAIHNAIQACKFADSTLDILESAVDISDSAEIGEISDAAHRHNLGEVKVSPWGHSTPAVQFNRSNITL